MKDGEGLGPVPGLQQGRGGRAPGLFVLLHGEAELLLPLQAAHQLLHGLRIPGNPGPEFGHGQGLWQVITHTATPAVGGQLKPEGGFCRPLFRGLLYGKPEVILVGPPSVEAAGVPVNTGDLPDKAAVRPLLPKIRVHLVPKFPHRVIKMFQIDLLVGLKPIPLVVEADAPHEIHRLAGKACKHGSLPISRNGPAQNGAVGVPDALERLRGCRLSRIKMIPECKAGSRKTHMRFAGPVPPVVHIIAQKGGPGNHPAATSPVGNADWTSTVWNLM